MDSDERATKGKLPDQITDEVYRALFIRGLYNKRIKCKVHDYLNIKTLGDTFRATRLIHTKLKTYEDIECQGDSDDDTNDNTPNTTQPSIQMVNQVDAEIINAVLNPPLPTPLDMCAHCVCAINGMLPPGKQQQQQKTFQWLFLQVWRTRTYVPCTYIFHASQTTTTGQ